MGPPLSPAIDEMPRSLKTTQASASLGPPAGKVSTHISRMDASVSSSRSDGSSLRARSQDHRSAQTSKPTIGMPRSMSVTRAKTSRTRRDTNDSRSEQSDAFGEWLKRKMDAPKEPRCSPTRAQIEKFIHENCKQRVLNQWHARFPRAKSKPATARDEFDVDNATL